MPRIAPASELPKASFYAVHAAAALALGARAWLVARSDQPLRLLVNGYYRADAGSTYLAGSEQLIDLLQLRVVGILLAAFAEALFIQHGYCRPVAKWLLTAGSAVLVGLALLSAAEKQYQWPQFTEHAAQALAPLLLAHHNWEAARLKRWLWAAIILTFGSHGLYALGWPFPQPGNFHEMVKAILALEPPAATVFLWAAGGLDMLVCVGLLVRPAARVALAYAAVWGLLTALARMVAYWDEELMTRWLFETLVRLPHSLLPLAGVWWVNSGSVK